MTEQDPSERGFRRLIREAREQMQAARSNYFSDKLAGSVSWGARHQLSRAAVQYYDALWEYRDRNAEIERSWNESEVDLIKQFSNQEVEVVTEATGLSPSGRKVQRNRLVACEPDMIVELTKQLDDLANQMGFAASTREITPHDEADSEDLRGLVELRGQQESAEEIPGGD